MIKKLMNNNKFALPFKVAMITSCLMLFFISGYAAKGWIIKINDNISISKGELSSNYNSSIDFKLLLSSSIGQSKKDIAKLRNSKVLKKQYMNSFIADVLIIEEAKKLKLYNEAKLNQKAAQFSKLLKHLMIKNLYLQELNKKIVKVDQTLLDQVFTQLSKNNPKFQKLNIKQKKQFAEQQARMTQLERMYIEHIEKLRNQNIIKINDNVEF